jgi:hypothetical protein
LTYDDEGVLGYLVHLLLNLETNEEANFYFSPFIMRKNRRVIPIVVYKDKEEVSILAQLCGEWG